MEYIYDEKTGKYVKRYRNEGICGVDGCDRPAKARGLCQQHYKQILKKGKIISKKITEPGQPIDLTGQKFGKLTALNPTDKRSIQGSVIWECKCDCGNKTTATAHTLKNNLKKSCGCLKKGGKRKFVPNPVFFRGDVAYLTIISKGKTFKFKIDRSDYDLIKDYRWALNNEGYVWSNKKDPKYTGEKQYLHRFLLGGYSPQIDHVNGDKLDNRRENLRPCNHTENFGNKRKRRTYAGKRCTSQYKGVSYNKKYKTWTATVGYENKKITKNFNNEIDAAKWYNKMATKIHGEFAHLNKLEMEADNVKETI